METKEIALSRIVENKDNPRTITENKFKKLVRSLLTFPRMLTLRPIVVDETMTVLGGNMRLKALSQIATMDRDSLRSVISENEKLTSGELDKLTNYWLGWQKNPVATIVNADDLTEAQKKEFIIKDNVGFGDWDMEMLANNWDTRKLADWGMNEWQLTGFITSAPTSPQATTDTSIDDTNVTCELPEELQGKELLPDKLPDIQGDDKVEKQRVIIVYGEEQSDKLAALLGLAKVDKVVYNLDELLDE